MGKVTSVKKEHCRMRFPGSFLKYLEIWFSFGTAMGDYYRKLCYRYTPCDGNDVKFLF